MSRRAPNPAADRAAQNQQTIKTLLKLEGNKNCADCKRNKHPRWASWNLGIFICIRCSGIHRGMGTHISRVKSVDLDAWTDEQLQSVLNWGNARANKYWEAKLAPGHVPSEAKIENFIRTKYESKRWTMEGPRPDPATLDDDDDDDVPLNVVQEKAKLDRSASQQKLPSPTRKAAVANAEVPNSDVFGDIPSPPARPNTTNTPNFPSAPAKNATSPKQAESSSSLLGLDFFGGPPSAATSKPNSVSSTPSSTTGQSRPDLKQSILSLYASTPRTQNRPQHERQISFGGMQSPSVQPNTQGGGFGGMDDAFSSLNFSSTTSLPSTVSQPPPKSNPFAAFDQPTSQRSAVISPQLPQAVKGGGGGTFFDPVSAAVPKPAPASKPPNNPLQTPQNNLSSLDFGNLGLTSSTSSGAQPKSTTVSHQSLFDFAEPTPQATAPKATSTTASSNLNSAFNLSKPVSTTPARPQATTSSISQLNAFSSLSSADPWGSNDAWASSEPTVKATSTTKPAVSKAPSIATTMDFSSWGGAPSSSSRNPARAAPKITEDEDFGGWTSAAAPISTSSTVTPKAGPTSSSSSNTKPASGYSASEDLFSNVWE